MSDGERELALGESGMGEREGETVSVRGRKALAPFPSTASTSWTSLFVETRSLSSDIYRESVYVPSSSSPTRFELIFISSLPSSRVVVLPLPSMAPSSSSLLPPLLPTFTTLLSSLRIPISLSDIQYISPLLLHTTLRAILREPLPLPPRSSSELEEQRRHELEMVKLVVGVLGQRVGLDFISLKPSRVVDGREKEIEVVSRGLLLLAFLQGWDGGMAWEPFKKTSAPSSSSRRNGEGKQERKKPPKKNVAFHSPFDESPPSTILLIPLTPIVSPRRPTQRSTSPPSISRSSPLPKPQASPPTSRQLDPPTPTPPVLRPPPLASNLPSSPNDFITRLTAPEEWNRRRRVETEALELAISRLVD